MKDRQKQLANELRQAGAGDQEIRELLPIAANLQLLSTPELPAFRPQSWWNRLLKPAVFVVPGAVIGMVVFVLAQGVLPNSWLYPVQQFSDRVATTVQPSYKAQVMMKRAEQVNQLVADGSDQQIIMATLASYTNLAKSYKSQAHANYAAFEYCKSNLQQAAANASPEVKSAITASLQTLDT